MGSIHTSKALINDFARRSFRDTADREYILARIAYKNSLFPQFFWSSLHALEKYTKAILLYNRVEAKNIKHEVAKAVNLINKKCPFEIEISDEADEFIKKIDSIGRFRYLEVSWWKNKHELIGLDKAVWQIRRYCQVLNFEVNQKNMLETNLRRIRGLEEKTRENTFVQGGLLEKIINKKKDPARKSLIWQNLYYSSRKRDVVRLRSSMAAENSPLYLHPEILDELLEYIYLPKDVVNAFKEHSKTKRGS